MKRPASVTATLFLLFTARTLSAAVIDFEGAPLGVDQTSVYVEEGFRISVVAGDYDIYPSDGFIGDGNYLALERFNSGTQQSTIRIDLFGASFAFGSLLSSSFGGRITFSDGASQLFGDFASEPVTVAFPGHTDLTWIELSSRSNDVLRVDNITLSPAVGVPEPATLALMGLALLATPRVTSKTGVGHGGMSGPAR